MGQFGSPVLSFACPLRLPNRTSISKVPTAFSDSERRFEAKAPRPPGGRVFTKPRSCLATPPEVTVIVAEERRTRSWRLWEREIAPAREVKARCPSPAELVCRPPAEAGGQSTREARGAQHGRGSLASVSEESWGPAALGLVLPSASYPAGNDTNVVSCPYFRDAPGRCVGERGLALARGAHGPPRGSKKGKALLP